MATTLDYQPKDLAPAVIARVDQIAAEVTTLKAQIRELQAEDRALLDAEALRLADFQIGSDVEMRYGYRRRGRPDVKRRYRITKIRGRIMRYEFEGEEIQAAQLWIEYYGPQVKADGTLSEKEHRLSEITEAGAL